MSSIQNFWQLPNWEQTAIKVGHPETTCAVCDTPEIRLVDCDVCGEEVCFQCAVPSESVKINRDGSSQLSEDTIICKNCLADTWTNPPEATSHA